MVTMSLSQTKIEQKIIDYQKSALAKNPGIKLNNISIAKSQTVGKGSWRAYTLEINLRYRNKNIDINDIIFSDGNLISTDFVDIDTRESIKGRFMPKVTDKYYDDKHLVVGNKNAKHKLLVFSDPLCPSCQAFVPKLISFAKKNKNSLALYYYGFPLVSIHPNAEIVTKMALVAKAKGMDPVDIKAKIYKAKLPSDITEEKAFKRVNKILGLKGKKAISKKDFDASINSTFKKDIKIGSILGISGTPTLYTNGEKDTHRQKYLKIIK